MPDDPAPTGAVAFLAKWTRRLSVEEFRACYESVYPPGQAKSWEVLVAEAGADIVLAACREAAEKAFLDRLGQAVGKWADDAGSNQDEIREMLVRTAGSGQMQAIVNQAAGLMDGRALLATVDAMNACAIVYQDNGAGRTFRGTSFLVRPDMVMTAAHVVLDSDGAAGAESWADHLLKDLVFSFKARDNAEETRRVQVRPAPTDPLVARSRPYGRWPNILALELGPPATPTLDYALIRLAQRVEHVKPVSVDPPSKVSRGRRCYAFGFPGGNAIMYDVDDVTDDAPGGGRWLHRANAAPGMSGGCCINHEGKLAGIHEGTVTIKVGDTDTEFNRGIGIADIRADQLANGRDPMAARFVAQGLEFDDPEMVGELYRAGTRLAGPAHAARWTATVSAVFAGADPAHAVNLPGFHAWFPRGDFEKWIDETAPSRRLCLVSGERGVGKSFCKQILKARLDPAGFDYFEVSPTQVAAFTPAETIGAGAISAPSENRTSAANFRYNDVGELIAQLQRGGSGDARSRTVAIDFGPEGGADRLIGGKWQEFIVRLLAEEWIRLVLIGLTAAERTLLIERVEQTSETADIFPEPIELGHVTAGEFAKWARNLAVARGTGIKAAELNTRIDATGASDPPALAPAPEMQTACLALAAIMLEDSLS